MSAVEVTRRAPTASAAGQRRGKRTLDIVGAALGLVALAPLLVLIALAVCLSSRGAPLFRQRRVGRDGREFQILKFRTMVSDAERLRQELMRLSGDRDWLVLERDPRVTRVGRLLRRTSLDELPQLLNVLRGDMSLVGPRPLPVVEHARVPAWAGVRTAMRPGVTGLWQVSGRASLSFADMLRLDCRYAREQSAWLDAKILLLTVPACLRGRGVN